MSIWKASYSACAITLVALACLGANPSWAECGNDTIENPEMCDGTDLGFLACKDFGFDDGTLSCAEDCSAFDTSECTTEPVCGNNSVEAGEVCDGEDSDGQSCETLGLGTGNLGCAADCSAFDTTHCTSEPVCGNDSIEIGEVCDGPNLGTLSCEDLGLGAGVLACAADCSAFDTSGCGSPVCGNNSIETGEICDDGDLDGQSCETLGLGTGNLGCAVDCSAFDTTFCTPEPICGNGSIEVGEACDGPNLGTLSCEDLGLGAGVLACAADCSAFDTSGCTSEPVCGNNSIETGEICDGGDLDEQSCATLGLGDGELGCTADCSTFDTSDCTGLEHGIKDRIASIKEQLVEIETGVVNLGEGVDEISSAQQAICDRPVSWNRKLPDSERFAPALNGHAYCDLETGLIWEEEPSPAYVTWKQAISMCRVTKVDGRGGWHVPTVEQLSTLLDTQNDSPALPSGHPFQGVIDELFWTTSVREPSLVGRTRHIWLVNMGGGFLSWFSSTENVEARAWCVRGAAGSPPVSEAGFFGED